MAGAAAALAGRNAVLGQTAGPAGSPFWGRPHVPPHWGHPYPLGPDSKRQPGVPVGKTFQFPIANSACYPGLACVIQVYVPAQYQAARPACVNLFFDGLNGQAPIVFDNLIHQGAMPVAIGIGLVSGRTDSAQPEVNPRFNRSFEFDSMTDVMAGFIVDEVLPEVQKRRNPDGRPIRLSEDPSDRLVGGASSGGIAAFNVAWRRPDAFRRVNIISGTFVGMRGGDHFAVLIRKTEPKPLRVFINDGTHDEWWGGPELGDWWISNQQVESALTYAGYDVNHLWGEGAHCQQGNAVLPDALRWLWAGWPKPVESAPPGNFNIQAIGQTGETWSLVAGGRTPAPAGARSFRGYASPPVVEAHSTAAALAADRAGRVFFMNPAEGRIDRLADDGRTEPFVSVSPGDNGLAFGPDGRLYVAETARSRIVAFDRAGRPQIVAEGLAGRALTVTHTGDLYVTEAQEGGAPSGQVWLIPAGGVKRVAADGLKGPSGLALTPDGLWMFVAEHGGHHGWSYQVQPNGDLRYGEPFYWVHVPDAAHDAGAGQVCMDRDGRAYAATREGIQVFDRNGRVTAILPVVPSAASRQLAGICFGGSDFKTLYVTTGTAIYRRNVSTVGSPAWAEPIALPPGSGG